MSYDLNESAFGHQRELLCYFFLLVAIEEGLEELHFDQLFRLEIYDELFDRSFGDAILTDAHHWLQGARFQFEVAILHRLWSVGSLYILSEAL